MLSATFFLDTFATLVVEDIAVELEVNRGTTPLVALLVMAAMLATSGKEVSRGVGGFRLILGTPRWVNNPLGFTLECPIFEVDLEEAVVLFAIEEEPPVCDLERALGIAEVVVVVVVEQVVLDLLEIMDIQLIVCWGVVCFFCEAIPLTAVVSGDVVGALGLSPRRGLHEFD